MRKLLFTISLLLLSTLAFGTNKHYQKPITLEFSDIIDFAKKIKNIQMVQRTTYLYIPFRTTLGSIYLSQTDLVQADSAQWKTCETVEDVQIDFTFAKAGVEPDFKSSFASIIIPKGTKSPIIISSKQLDLYTREGTIIAARGRSIIGGSPLLCTYKSPQRLPTTQYTNLELVGGIISELNQ